MIREIKILNRFNVELFLGGLQRPPSKEFCLISITNVDDVLVSDTNIPFLRSIGCIKELPVQFTDITPDDKLSLRMAQRLPKKFKLFDNEDAKKIIAFIDEMNAHPEPMDLIVHCQAGISRSGAVAVFASKRLKINFFDPYIDPNPYVLSTLESIAASSH